MILTLPDSAIRRIAISQREAFWTKRERERSRISDILMAAGYGDWIAGVLADQYLDGEELDIETLELIEESQKVAGWWDDAKRIVLPRMDMQPWADELAAKLEAIGMSINDFENTDIVWWHEEGYNTDEALQMALQFG